MTEKWDQVCVFGGVDCVWLKTVNPVGAQRNQKVRHVLFGVLFLEVEPSVFHPGRRHLGFFLFLSPIPQSIPLG